MELDYEDDERASVLPDEGDEADCTAEGGMTSLVASNGDGTQAILVSNPDEANDKEPANTQEGADNIDDKRPTGPQDGCFTLSSSPGSRKNHQECSRPCVCQWFNGL